MFIHVFIKMISRYSICVPCNIAMSCIKPASSIEHSDFLEIVSTLIAIELCTWTAQNVRVCVYKEGKNLYVRCSIYSTNSCSYVGNFSQTLCAMLGISPTCTLQCSYNDTQTQRSARVFASWLRACGDLVDV